MMLVFLAVLSLVSAAPLDGQDTSLKGTGEFPPVYFAETSQEPTEPAPVAGPECPSCAPGGGLTSLPVVVPFYSGDLCKVKFLARGLAKHDTNNVFNSVHLVWTDSKPLSDFAQEIDEIKSDLATKNVHVLQHVDLPGGGWSNEGWYLQQQVKLRGHELVGDASHFVVLDSKNVMINPLNMSSMFDNCGRVIEHHLPKKHDLHDEWGRKSAEALGLHVSEDLTWPESITPVVFHVSTLKSMLGLLEVTSPNLETALHKGATEFMLYRAYIRSDEHNQECQCTHVLRDDPEFEKKNAMMTTLFETTPKEAARKRLTNLVAGTDRPVFFGAQRQFQKSELGQEDAGFVRQKMGQVYANAGLLRETDDENMKNGCFDV